MHFVQPLNNDKILQPLENVMSATLPVSLKSAVEFFNTPIQFNTPILNIEVF